MKNLHIVNTIQNNLFCRITEYLAYLTHQRFLYRVQVNMYDSSSSANKERTIPQLAFSNYSLNICTI